MKTTLAYLFIVAVASVSAAPETSFTFATWNVGHFSLGRYETSTIAADNVPQMLSAYSAFLDKADASIIGLCEYSWFFDKEGVRPAHETVFARYSGSAKSQRQYDFNVLYWTNAHFIAENVVWFKQLNAPRFYRHVKLSLAGRTFSFVETHLDWNTLDPGHENDRADQILQLIEDFKDEPLVVIAGDFNTCVKVNGVWEDAPKEYEPFRKAGYAAAHMGELLTWPSDKPRMSIDNIFAKGLKISDVKVFADPTLSDHALLRCRLTMSAAEDRPL